MPPAMKSLARLASADRLSAALFLLLAAVIALTFRQYGIGYDESFNRDYGALVHKFYATYFSAAPDKGALGYLNMHLYGGFFDVVGYELNRVLPFGEYENRHLWTAVVGVLGVVGCWKTARVLGGPAAAAWAALLLVLTPAYYGHLFNNPKDIPFAAGYIWSLYYLICVLNAFPRVRHTLALRLGLAIGLTMAVRAGGLLLLAYTAGAAAIYLVARTIAHRQSLLPDGLRVLLTVGIAASVAWATMLLFWPYAATHPVDGPFRALAELANFKYRDTLRFQGREISTSEVPWFYLPQYLVIQLPEITLALLAIGVVLAVWWLARVRSLSDAGRAAGASLLIFASVFPVAYIVAKQSVVYDAARHVTFILPPLVCLAALTIDRLVKWTAAYSKPVRVAAAAGLVILCAAPARAMVALHPYQYIYFNVFAGGLPGAAAKYETDYWAHCYRATALALEARVTDEATSKPQAASGPYLVYVIQPWVPATYFFSDKLVWTREVRKADFAISYTRYNSHTVFARDPVYVTVERQGVPLCYAFDRRAGR